MKVVMNPNSPIIYKESLAKKMYKNDRLDDITTKGFAGLAAGSIIGMSTLLLNDAKHYPNPPAVKIVGRSAAMGAGLFLFFDYFYRGLFQMAKNEED